MSVPGETAGKRSDVTIRAMLPSDVPALSSILLESPGASSWPDDSLLDSLKFGTGWVADLENRVVGFLIGKGVADEFEILNLAVAQACRRRGIATELLKTMAAWSITAGTKQVYLEVRASNEAAMALYVQNGFKPCGRRVRYYQYPVEDAIVLSWDRIGTLK
jgi:ribosomal-protein-alanine N-acetyltransferase